MKALCYTRPWTEEYFRRLCAGVFGATGVIYISDFRGHGDWSLSDAFYRYYERPPGRPPHLPAAMREDVIRRCRLLRQLPCSQAERMVDAMTLAIEEALDRAQPEIVVSMTVDSYVIDLLRFISEARGIPFFGICSFLLEGYFLVTGRGEYNPFRTPREEECDEALRMLRQPTHRAVYVPPNATARRKVFRRWIREAAKLVYFPLLRVLKRDPWNYHYRGSQATARERARLSNLLPWPYEDRDWETRLHRHRGVVAYLPLQYHPECNTDYWWNAQEYLDYEEAVLKLLRALDGDVLCLVKEHPNMLGYRAVEFYQHLQAIGRVMLVPSYVSSRRLIDASHMALTSSGSVGIEAVVGGKGVLTYGRPYYVYGRLFRSVLSDAQLAQLPGMVSSLLAESAPSDDEKRALLRHIFSGCLPGYVWKDAFSPGWNLTQEKIDLTARVIRENLDAFVAYRTNQLAQPFPRIGSQAATR